MPRLLTLPTVTTPPHVLATEAVAAALAVDPDRGLAPDEVARRAAESGPNALEEARRDPVWRMVLEAVIEPFVLMLLGAGLLAVLLGEVRDGLLVLVGLVPIVGADVITEYRGERALEALRAATAPTARARRGGRVATVPAAALVPGDIVLLQAGDVVPADLRVLHATRLLVDRSVLTGESVPEEAVAAPDPEDAPLSARRSMAYSGTSIVGGRGEGVVTAIGQATEVGRIAGGLTSVQRRRSPLQRELDRLVRILLVVAVFLVGFTAGMGFLRGHPAGENLLAGISAAIAAIPEEPPVLLAVVLGLGAYRLLRRGVLVRRLNAEETLGAVDLIITDKTGTITRNRLDVAAIRTPDGMVGEGPLRTRLLEEALRAEEDAWSGEAVVPGSFTRALRAAVEAAGGNAAPDPADLITAAPPTDAHPVSTTQARRDGDVEELALGAPEAVLRLVDEAGAPAWQTNAQWRQRVDEATAAGERVVALARRVGDGAWSMRALVGFADPMRPGIPDAVAMARGAGIQVVVVTGDHPQTAAAIARQAGIDEAGAVTGGDLEAWDEERLASELAGLRVVARSTPDQKLRLVRAARAMRRIVAVTGDGVNDAPALHGADVAVAMGSGTGVAKEAADLVLGDDSFATLMFGLAEGRRIVDNVQKGLVFLVSTHVAFLGFILVATIFVAERQVLIPLQILWMELFIDLATSVAFERERPEPGLMTRAPRHAERPLLTDRILVGIALAGGYTAIAALAVMLASDLPLDQAAWLAYTILVVSQCVRAYANRSIRLPVHRLGPNAFLAAACVLAVVIQGLIPYIPPVAEAFRATPLGPDQWLLVAGVALAPAVVAEIVRTLGRGRITWIA